MAWGEAIDDSPRKLSEVDLRDGDSGDGVNGALCLDGDLGWKIIERRKSVILEGDLESDRLISLMAEVVSI